MLPSSVVESLSSAGRLLKERGRVMNPNTTHAVYEKTWDEDDHGAKLITWRDANPLNLPGLKHLHHIPNGSRMHTAGRAQGYAPKEALRLRAQGVNRGVSDYFLPYPCGGHHGLYLELKSLKGRPTPEQVAFLADMGEVGYATVIAKGWREAVSAIIEYYAKGLYGVKFT